MNKQLGLSFNGILRLKGMTWVLDMKTRSPVLERSYNIY